MIMLKSRFFTSLKIQIVRMEDESNKKHVHIAKIDMPFIYRVQGEKKCQR